MPRPTTLLFAVLSFGCANSDDPGASSGTGTPSVGETAATDTGGEDPSSDSLYFQPSTLQLYSQFGYNADTDSFYAPEYGGWDIVPSITILLGDENWNGTDFSAYDEYCVLQFDLMESEPGSGWATGLWLDRDWSENSMRGEYCSTSGKDLDPTVWGEDPIATLAALGPWGVGIGELSASAAKFAGPLEVGGYFESPILDFEEGREGYVVSGREVDPVTLAIENGAIDPADMVTAEGGLATGYYDVRSVYLHPVPSF